MSAATLCSGSSLRDLARADPCRRPDYWNRCGRGGGGRALADAGGPGCLPRRPRAAYEALGTLCILGILLLLRRRGVPDGWLSVAYLILYPVSQLLLFTVRSTEPVLWLGLKQAE